MLTRALTMRAFSEVSDDAAQRIFGASARVQSAVDAEAQRLRVQLPTRELSGEDVRWRSH